METARWPGTRPRLRLSWAVMADVIDVLREGLAPRYEVERQIGAGGMARVYLATEQHPRRPVAIKVLEPDISTRLLYDRETAVDLLQTAMLQGIDFA